MARAGQERDSGTKALGRIRRGGATGVSRSYGGAADGAAWAKPNEPPSRLLVDGPDAGTIPLTPAQFPTMAIAPQSAADAGSKRSPWSFSLLTLFLATG